MRPRQPTLIFGFIVLAGLVRMFAYAGTPIGQDLSVAALLDYVALHVLMFAFAALLVAYLSRATATRAAFIALYAQGVLFLAPFVDIGLGRSLEDFAQTYAGVFGGSPGSIVAALGYGAVVTWGVHDATLGLPRARFFAAGLAGVGAVLGASLLAIPWPRLLLLGATPWSVHLALASYFALLGAMFLALALRFGNPALFRATWRQVAPIQAAGFAIFPLLGVVTEGRLLAPQVPNEDAQRFLVEVPYVLVGMASAAALWLQCRLVRGTGGARRLEVAAAAKAVALAFALPLGILPFLVCAAGASATWLGRVHRFDVVLGSVAACAVLVGSLTVVAVNFADAAVGPAIIAVPLDQNPSLSMESAAVAGLAGILVPLLAYVTSRTSASGRGRASS